MAQRPATGAPARAAKRRAKRRAMRRTGKAAAARSARKRVSRAKTLTRAKQPRNRSRAADLAAATCALAEGRHADAQAVALALEAPPGARQDDTPVDIGDLIERLLRGLRSEIGVYETLLAKLESEPQSQRKAMETARALSSLTDTLNRLQRMRAEEKPPAEAHEEYDDLPTDIDAFRDALARRIEAFMESRTDEECGLQDDRAGDGAAEP